MTLRNRVSRLVALAMLSGCSQLPLDGPASHDIAAGASAGLVNPPQAAVYNYALVDINPNVLDCLVEIETGSFSKSFGGSAPALRAGVGDVVELSVFESGVGGLFIPTAANARTGNFVTVPKQTVSGSGTISVPYAGVIRVAGRTPPEIEREIESKLANRALEPQVVFTMIEKNAGNVTVVGDTTAGSSQLKLTGSGERVLDMVSKVGGLNFRPMKPL